MKRTFYAVLVGLICFAQVDAADNHKPSAQPAWNLKYKSGSFQLRKEQWLKGTFVAGAMAEKQRNAIVVIPTDGVRAVYFDPRAQNDSELLEHMPRSGCAYAESLMPKDDAAPSSLVFLVWMESPRPISRAAEHLNARYPVKFTWNDAGSEREIMLSVNYCEYASFLANVRWFVGSRWREIGKELPK
jgi:hypothetical protein